jgi:hypothetical protein
LGNNIVDPSTALRMKNLPGGRVELPTKGL